MLLHDHAIMKGNPIQDNMNERKNDNEPRQPGAASDTNTCKSNDHVDILHVPTKVQDGNANNFQYEVSPMPTSNIYHNDDATAPISSNPMGSDYFFSPMPPTPHAAMDVTPTPQSYMSKDTTLLAALYQSSRKSRASPPTSIHSAAAAPLNARQGFLPPPPLASASPKPETSSFQPKNDPLNANWGPSGNHMTDFIRAPPLYNSDSAAINERTRVQDSRVYNPPAPFAKEPQGDCTDDPYLTPLLPAKQTVSLAQFEFTPNATMDHQLLDLANESFANVCMKFSEQRSRSFEAEEEELVLPPRKKYRQGDTRVDFGDAVASMTNNISYNTYPTREARPLTKFEESVQSLIAQSKTKKKPIQEVSFQPGSEPKETHSDKKDQDIIRRKVQRLLLIRHATRCKVPLNSDPNDDGYQECTCPVTPQCGEGRRLASHIRKCRDVNCQYKWCLTTRDVLGHYQSCRDRKCQICGPVRAMHPSRRVKGRGRER